MKVKQVILKMEDGSFKGYSYSAFKAMLQQHFYARYSLKEPTLEEVYEELGIDKINSY